MSAADETVIREVAQNLWTFARPFARFNLVPVGGRSTAIKLSNSDVWILASTPLTDETKKTLDSLGPVRYIVAPNVAHNLFIGQYKKAYPDAKLIGIPDLIEKKKAEELTFDGVYGKDPAGTKYGYEPEIEAVYFSGFINKDIAFFHQASKTLIQADLLFNLPGTEQYSKSKSSAKIPIFGGFSSSSYVHKKFVLSGGKDKEAMKRDVAAVTAWDFTRIIPCHGDVIENDGKNAWREAFAAYL
jgi:hypothetical protein